MTAKFLSLSGQTKERMIVLSITVVLLAFGLYLLSKSDGFGLNIGTGVYTLLVGIVGWRISDLVGCIRQELAQQRPRSSSP